MKDERREQLERILASPQFAQTERLSRFLRYAVEETLAGRQAEIKESTIGVTVFGKPAGFDPKLDSTVRSEAVKLRSRLAAYYDNGGRNDPWVISIPKGTYVPVFTAVPEAPAAEVADTAADPVRRSWLPYLAASLTVGAVLAGIWVWYRESTSAITLGRSVRVTWERGVNTDPALSAEGKLLAYASTRGGDGQLDIWIRPVAPGTGEALRLTSHPADDSQPDISPHGDVVAFRSERNGGGIYTVSAVGGHERLLVPGGRAPRFSPDGKFIVYYLGDPSLLRSAIASGGGIFIVDAAGSSPPRQLVPEFGAAISPLWSPDGKYILFLGYPEQDVAAIKLDWWLAPADGSSKARSVGFNASAEKNGICGAASSTPRSWIGDQVLFAYLCEGTRGIGHLVGCPGWQDPTRSAHRKPRQRTVSFHFRGRTHAAVYFRPLRKPGCLEEGSPLRARTVVRRWPRHSDIPRNQPRRSRCNLYRLGAGF